LLTLSARISNKKKPAPLKSGQLEKELLPLAATALAALLTATLLTTTATLLTTTAALLTTTLAALLTATALATTLTAATLATTLTAAALTLLGHPWIVRHWIFPFITVSRNNPI
jgi:hypothetical protein